MARDYRYGHKHAQHGTRRSQTGDEAPWVVEAESAPARKPARKGRTSDKSPAANAAESTPAVSRPARSRPPELEKALARAAGQSRAKALRDPELVMDASAEPVVALPQALPSAGQHQSGGHGVSWFKWLTLLMISSLVIGWLAYAPFFLAFAEGMGWIDADTRARWDNQPLRAQVLTISQQVSEAAVSKPVPLPEASKPAEPPSPPPVAFTFYEELPKAAINPGAQPLPVRTRVPVYVQVAAIADHAQAQAERRRLAQKGYMTQLSAQLQQEKSVYVLRMGPYEDQRVINRLKVELSKLGVDAKEVNMITASKTAVDTSSQAGMEQLQGVTRKAPTAAPVQTR